MTETKSRQIHTLVCGWCGQLKTKLPTPSTNTTTATTAATPAADRNQRGKSSTLFFSILCLDNGVHLIAILSIGSFFVGYTFEPSVPDFQFPYPHYWEYPLYIALALANFCGVKGANFISYGVGFFILFLTIIVGYIHARRILTENPDSTNLSQVILILIGFTLVFCINLAIGRISLGLEEAQASRYIPYLIPGFFALYLHATTLRLKKKAFVMGAIVLCLVSPCANIGWYNSPYQLIV